MLILCLLSSCGASSGTDQSTSEWDGNSESEQHPFDTDISTGGGLVSTSESVQDSDASDTTEQSLTPDTTPTTDDRVRLVMVGDILMHDPVLESGKLADGYSFEHLFENLSDDIASADIAMFNQEVIIAGEKYGIDGYPRFNAPYELADALAKAGFDVALHATNHTLDVGKDAMLDCLDYWQTRHPSVEVVGMHDTEADAQHISVIDKNGIRVAILNYTEIMNGAGRPIVSSFPYLVDMLDEQRLIRDTRVASEIADFVIVAVHWGSEYTHTPTSSQRRWASLMLECGVDLVLGTHPHVIQPIEWLEGQNGKMLVYWSLGNFVNSTGESGVGKGARMLGAMADVVLEKDASGNVGIAQACAVPLITHIEYKSCGITTYKFSDYLGSMLNRSEATRIDPSFTYGYCERTFAEILGEFRKK